MAKQKSMFEEKAALSALDDLFRSSQAYSSSLRYGELMQFIAKFPSYSPFNCFLLHVQKPGVTCVATHAQWKQRFGRTIRADARPLVILAPMSPVLFVFDAEDTEGGDPLPDDLVNPFATKGVLPEKIWEKTLANLPRDAVLLIELAMGQASAGSICLADPEDYLKVGETIKKARYRLKVNKNLDAGGRYATLVHELGHLYAGHQGSPNPKWWPDRRALTKEQREFEAESICYLVCERAGVKTPSDAYLADYLGKNITIPQISLDCVLKAAGQIAEMGKRKLPPRKDDTLAPHG